MKTDVKFYYTCNNPEHNKRKILGEVVRPSSFEDCICATKNWLNKIARKIKNYWNKEFIDIPVVGYWNINELLIWTYFHLQFTKREKERTEKHSHKSKAIWRTRKVRTQLAGIYDTTCCWRADQLSTPNLKNKQSFHCECPLNVISKVGPINKPMY